MFESDKRTVVTLDAGGTNFVFGAMQGNKFVVDPISKPSCANSLDTCLGTMVEGFTEVIAKLSTKPVAISFAFPGPADYPSGVIGGYLPNFPSFRSGVALKAFLEDKFNIPVYLNNDGDLYAYGEAVAGALPYVNSKLKEMGSVRQHKNLIGYTWGTGLGIGFVMDGKLNQGDNSCVETYCLRNKKDPSLIAEDGAAIRAVKRVYGELTGNPDHGFEPHEIFEIAEGTREGDRAAAANAFEEFGEVAGDAIATAVTLMDGLVVIGGGIAAARKYIMPGLFREMRSTMRTLSGDIIDRLPFKVYDLDDEEQFKKFAKGESRELKVYGTDKTVICDPQKRIGVMTSKLGASNAISIGAYAFALNAIDGN